MPRGCTRYDIYETRCDTLFARKICTKHRKRLCQRFRAHARGGCQLGSPAPTTDLTYVQVAVEGRTERTEGQRKEKRKRALFASFRCPLCKTPAGPTNADNLTVHTWYMMEEQAHLTRSGEQPRRTSNPNNARRVDSAPGAITTAKGRSRSLSPSAERTGKAGGWVPVPTALITIAIKNVCIEGALGRLSGRGT